VLKFVSPSCHSSSEELPISVSALLSSENLSPDNTNLSAAQRKLLLCHCQLGHLHMTRVQSLA
jgi:hypothetical protein